jgi:hypothetical protein
MPNGSATLSISHMKVGIVMEHQGNLGGALASFRSAGAIQRRLTGSDDSNAERQRDLITVESKIGDIAMAQGDLTAAETAYRAALGRPGPPEIDRAEQTVLAQFQLTASNRRATAFARFCTILHERQKVI